MNLERLCELLGFEIGCDIVPADIPGDKAYSYQAILSTDYYTSQESAKKALQDKLEQILTDVVNANKEKK